VAFDLLRTEPGRGILLPLALVSGCGGRGHAERWQDGNIGCLFFLLLIIIIFFFKFTTGRIRIRA
jgi:hypothetical protein